MYCSKCGRQLPEGVTVCPDCSGDAPQVKAEKVSEPVLKAPGKFSKSYAAIFTALLVFPASICIAVDLVFDKYDYWFGYVVGALAVVWVLSVFPILRITPPLVTALICFGSIMCYVFYLASKTGRFIGFSKVALPMFVLTAFFIALDVALIGGQKIRGLHIFSFLSLECALYLICLEATIDNLRHGAIDLKWSVIAACGFISVIAVMEAFSYVGRINRK